MGDFGKRPGSSSGTMSFHWTSAAPGDTERWRIVPQENMDWKLPPELPRLRQGHHPLPQPLQAAGASPEFAQPQLRLFPSAWRRQYCGHPLALSTLPTVLEVCRAPQIAARIGDASLCLPHCWVESPETPGTGALLTPCMCSLHRLIFKRKKQNPSSIVFIEEIQVGMKRPFHVGERGFCGITFSAPARYPVLRV